MTTEIPQCDMIIMFVQSDKYNPKGLLKKSHSVSPALVIKAVLTYKPFKT